MATHDMDKGKQLFLYQLLLSGVWWIQKWQNGDKKEGNIGIGWSIASALVIDMGLWVSRWHSEDSLYLDSYCQDKVWFDYALRLHCRWKSMLYM